MPRLSAVGISGLQAGEDVKKTALHRIAGGEPGRAEAVVYPFPPPKRPLKDPKQEDEHA